MEDNGIINCHKVHEYQGNETDVVTLVLDHQKPLFKNKQYLVSAISRARIRLNIISVNCSTKLTETHKLTLSGAGMNIR